MTSDFIIRIAGGSDIAALHELIALSVRGLMPGPYSGTQLEAALGTWLGVDTSLVSDRTYFVVEAKLGSVVKMVACGGWSKRKTPYGSDNRPGREDALLDPSVDAAKIRAFFVHPAWARQGIGTLILDACEHAAREAGFLRFELGATLSGVPFYAARGYEPEQEVKLPLSNGETLPILRMTKKA